jgi:hypothetical protein
MKPIKSSFILPSAAMTICKKDILYYDPIEKVPEVGDVIYGKVIRMGQHICLENQYGRLHNIQDGSKAIFIFGNRYAPDFYEGVIPQTDCGAEEVDLLARSGLIGKLKNKNELVLDPTIIKIIGYVVNKNGEVLNTTEFSKIKLRKNLSSKTKKRAKMILSIGSSMNSGKSVTAAACCWALSTAGHSVRGSKITGTASLKDILLMQDKGAEIICDFTYMGYPSTYLLSEEKLLEIFNQIDLKYANNPLNYWVVEIADGLLQRETAMLLQSPFLQKRIHKLIFSAKDAMGVISGLTILKDRFQLFPDAISGTCSSSPLAIKEFSDFTDIPVFSNLSPNLKTLCDILI